MKVYRPAIRRTVINPNRPGHSPGMAYNHDSDITLFRDRFVAAWNANERSKHEGVPGQFNYLSLSEDFDRWSKPARCFTSHHGADAPVDGDGQWQPCFLNLRDEALFCAWCRVPYRDRAAHDPAAAELYVSRSTDAARWTNRRIDAPPPGMGRTVGFPTSHGLLSPSGALLFPCSLHPVPGSVGQTRAAAILRSDDEGGSWHWSEPIHAVNWSDLGVDPALHGGDTIHLWEPALYDMGDGRIGLLIRNEVPGDADVAAHHMMLSAASDDDGRTWSRATPVALDTVCSRAWAAAGDALGGGMAAVANDWAPRVPHDKPHDRHNLALFLAPTPDPDLLVPGPLVQPTGGIAYYPNGEAVPRDRGGGLLLSFTHAGIHACRVEPLPDPDRPWLIPRGGRTPADASDGRVVLHHEDSSVAVLPPRSAVSSTRAALRCRLRLDHYSGFPTTLMSVGVGDAAIALQVAATEHDDRLMIRAGGATHDLGPIELGRVTDLRLEVGPYACRIEAAGARREMPTPQASPSLAFGNRRHRPSTPTPPSGELSATFEAIDLS